MYAQYNTWRIIEQHAAGIGVGDVRKWHSVLRLELRAITVSGAKQIPYSSNLKVGIIVRKLLLAL